MVFRSNGTSLRVDGKYKDETSFMDLPSFESLYEAEYQSKPGGHNWPRSFEQYKSQVGGLQKDMDDVYDLMEEYEELIKELQRDIKDLERRKRDK